jgi:hypothetical protein
MQSYLQKTGIRIFMKVVSSISVAFLMLVQSSGAIRGISINELSKKVDEIRATSKNTGELESRLKGYLEGLQLLRTKEYLQTPIQVSSKWKTASMGTSVNGSEGRKNLKFTVKPPVPKMVHVDPLRPAEIQMERGSRRRVKVYAPEVDAEEVTFSLALIEPDLFEKDVHIRYRGVVRYRHTQSSAENAANRDLKEIAEYIEKTIAASTISTSEPVLKPKPQAEPEKEEESEPDTKENVTAGERRLTEFLYLGMIPLLVATIPIYLQRKKSSRRRATPRRGKAAERRGEKDPFESQ